MWSMGITISSNILWPFNLAWQLEPTRVLNTNNAVDISIKCCNLTWNVFNTSSGAGLTKPIYWIRLTSQHFRIAKTLLIYWISRSHLIGVPAKYEYDIYALRGTFAKSDIYWMDLTEKLTNEASVTPTSVVFIYQYHGCCYHYRYHYYFVWGHTLHLHTLWKCIPPHDE